MVEPSRFFCEQCGTIHPGTTGCPIRVAQPDPQPVEPRECCETQEGAVHEPWCDVGSYEREKAQPDPQPVEGERWIARDEDGTEELVPDGCLRYASRQPVWELFEVAPAQKLEEAERERDKARDDVTTLRHTTVARLCQERDAANTRAELSEQKLQQVEAEADKRLADFEQALLNTAVAVVEEAVRAAKQGIEDD